jgi:hypothetical protein
VDSILTSIKKLLGIEADYTHFDPDIIININMVFMVLNQLGVGPSTCFSITDSTKVWSDFMSTSTNIEAVKTYVYLKVRLVFDPPTTSAAIEAIERQIDELEWRLNAQVEPPIVPVVTDPTV